MKVERILILLLAIVLCSVKIFAVKYGSETAVTLQPFVSFPSSDTDNELLPFGWFKNGFGFLDDTVSCTFNSVFPVSGSVALEGGSLFLGTDLHLQNITTLSRLGHIYGQGHIVTIDSSVQYFTGSADTVFFDNLDLVVNSDLIISTTLNITGTCFINGRNKRIYMDSDSEIIVGHNAILSLKNLEVEGVKRANIRCLDETGKILLDNVSLYMDENYDFTIGKLEVWNEVDFSGSYTFFYDSVQTLSVAANSVFKICDGASFGVGLNKDLASNRIMYLTDESSKFWVDNGNVIIGPNGVSIARGGMVLNGRVNFDIRSTCTNNGLIIGDGTAVGDVVAEFYPAAYVTFMNGHVSYNESNPYKFISKSTYSKLIRGAENTFHVMRNQVYSNVTIMAQATSALSVEKGAFLRYEDCSIILPNIKYTITGSRYDMYTTLLNGNDEIFLEEGILPFYLLIKNSENWISGNGSLSGLTMLYDSDAVLNFKMDGYVLDNVILNNGKINLLKDLTFSYDKALLGAGSVDLGNNNLVLGANDVSWTSSIYWNGSNGGVALNSKVSLSSTWTFSGNCTIRGNGAVLDLGTNGRIYVERGSTLKFNNVTLAGISDKCIQCLDNFGKIIFDETSIIQDGDFNFAAGKLQLNNLVDFSGTYTFFYDSTSTITVSRNASLVFDSGMTFALGTKTLLSKDRIFYFTDRSSSVCFRDSNLHVGPGGFRCTRGTAIFSGYSGVESDMTTSDRGLLLGDGTSGNDCVVRFEAASLVQFKRGSLVYNLANPRSFISSSLYSKMVRCANNSFYGLSDAVFGNISIEIDPLSEMIITDGKYINYNNCRMLLPTVKYTLTGTRFNSYTFALCGSDELFLENGTFPLYLLVSGVENYVLGSGDVSGQITFENSSSELNVCLEGQILNNVNLNSGKFILAKDLFMGINSHFTGSGLIDLKGYGLDLSMQDISWTSSIYWDGSGGKISLNSMLSLSSSWTFSGNCTISGNNNVLFMNPSGRIYVERGSVLTLKNLRIYGLEGENISCLDNAGMIIFSNSKSKLTDDFNFSKGAFQIDYEFDVKGDNKTFHYSSTVPSLIRNCSTLSILPTMIFDYCPMSDDKDLIQMECDGSVISLNEATLHSSTTGMQLTRGSLYVTGKCYVASDASSISESIIGGDGISADNDLRIKIFDSSTLEFTSGCFILKNLN